ncbi:hypothetical protein IU46_018755 [Pantoea agglomerans]|nr:hypothetical protein IU46_018755 [Pantoea agglomerans]
MCSFLKHSEITMKDGLYHVNFKSNQQDFGVALLLLKMERLTVAIMHTFTKVISLKNLLCLK